MLQLRQNTNSYRQVVVVLKSVVVGWWSSHRRDLPLPQTRLAATRDAGFYAAVKRQGLRRNAEPEIASLPASLRTPGIWDGKRYRCSTAPAACPIRFLVCSCIFISLTHSSLLLHPAPFSSFSRSPVCIALESFNIGKLTHIQLI